MDSPGRRRIWAAALLALVALALPAATADAAKPRAAPLYVQADIQRDGRLTILRTGVLRVRLRASRPVTVTVSAQVRVGTVVQRRSGGRPRVHNRTLRMNRGRRTIALRLTATGRRTLQDCRIARIVLQSRSRQLRRSGRRLVPRGPTKTRKAGTTYPRVSFGCRRGRIVVPGASGGPAGQGSGYSVGVAARAINPGPDGKFNGQPVYLGGYGIAANRPATGVLREGAHVRAIAFSDGRQSAVFADIETQGWFVANKDAPYGLVDMRRAVEQQTRGALRAQQVVIQSDHSHSGADPMGVWGGVPLAFRKFMFDQTVAAIVEAHRTMRRGTLYYGATNGRDLLDNQFDYDAANSVVDSDVRVLQARDDNGQPFATLLNFSAHTTVLGSSNTKVSGDWVQAANPLLTQRFGGEPMTMVGTLGRTQPADGPCPNASLQGDARSLCVIEDYARRVVDRAAVAAANATALGGAPVVAARSYLIQDVSSNAILLGLLLGGEAAGAPVNRSLTPPWLTGNVLGTVTGSVRIGDVLTSTIPGEAYPQIALKVRDVARGLRGYMTAGLAQDQLGYLIAPYESYPEPIRRSFFNQRGDEVSPIDNDNYFFNVSHTMGERVTCSLLRGAGEVFGRGSTYRNAHDRCATFPNDMALAPGADAG